MQESQIIHWDIKASNLLVNIEEDCKSDSKTDQTILNSKFEIKVGDFGFARKL